MIKAVIFDMDGLLVDSEAATFLFYKDICEGYGKAFEMSHYIKFLGTNATYIESCLTEYYKDQALSKRIMAEVHESLALSFEEQGVPLKKGARTILEYLKNSGMKLAVATSSSRNRATQMLDRSGVIDYFDIIVCGDEVENSKPHPDIFLKAAALLGCEPAQTLVIEDSENGIKGAHRGGMHSINVPDLKDPSEWVKEKATYIAKDLLEAMAYIQNIK
jgi:HAD superfamily hydrolase (TIGR01509 family)